MDLVRWEPFDGFTKMQSRINALFDEVFDRANGHSQAYSGVWGPPVDILESRDSYLIRAELPGMEWLREELLGESARPKIEKVKKLKAVADRLGCTRAQLAIAWCLKNPHVSSAITGATRREQVNENLGAMAVAERLNGEVMRDIDRILEGR